MIHKNHFNVFVHISFKNIIRKEIKLNTLHEIENKRQNVMPFKFGFYEELDDMKEEFPESTFEFMENVFVYQLKDQLIFNKLSAYDFIHGYCAPFAYLLSKNLKYPMYLRRFVNESEALFVHVWCQKDNWYIDARGCTQNFSDFWSEFEDFDSFDLDDENYETLKFEKAEDFSSFLEKRKIKGVISDELINASQALFNDYKEYYILPPQ